MGLKPQLGPARWHLYFEPTYNGEFQKYNVYKFQIDKIDRNWKYLTASDAIIFSAIFSDLVDIDEVVPGTDSQQVSICGLQEMNVSH